MSIHTIWIGQTKKMTKTRTSGSTKMPPSSPKLIPPRLWLLAAVGAVHQHTVLVAQRPDGELLPAFGAVPSARAPGHTPTLTCTGFTIHPSATSRAHT